MILQLLKANVAAPALRQLHAERQATVLQYIREIPVNELLLKCHRRRGYHQFFFPGPRNRQRGHTISDRLAGASPSLDHSDSLRGVRISQGVSDLRYHLTLPPPRI